jgi:hypothetical protein
MRVTSWQAVAVPSSKIQATSSSFAVAQGVTVQGLWFVGLFLLCITVLLIASMVLMGRVIHRD